MDPPTQKGAALEEFDLRSPVRRLFESLSASSFRLMTCISAEISFPSKLPAGVVCVESYLVQGLDFATD